MLNTLLSIIGERTSGDNIRTQNGNYLTFSSSSLYFQDFEWGALFLHFPFFENESYFEHIHDLIFSFLVTAVTAVANIVRSSLGPTGLDKMMIDEVHIFV